MSKATQEQHYYHRINGEVNRIRRFLTEERIIENAAMDLKKEGDSAGKLNADKEAANSVPSRKVLSAMAMHAVQNTSHFIENC